MKARFELMDRLREAFDAIPSESLHEAATRVLKRGPSPAWAAARKVVYSGDLRDDAAWQAIAEAVELLR